LHKVVDTAASRFQALLQMKRKNAVVARAAIALEQVDAIFRILFFKLS